MVCYSTLFFDSTMSMVISNSIYNFLREFDGCNDCKHSKMFCSDCQKIVDHLENMDDDITAQANVAYNYCCDNSDDFDVRDNIDDSDNSDDSDDIDDSDDDTWCGMCRYTDDICDLCYHMSYHVGTECGCHYESGSESGSESDCDTGSDTSSDSGSDC